jgi:hypothetical protein
MRSPSPAVTRALTPGTLARDAPTRGALGRGAVAVLVVAGVLGAVPPAGPAAAATGGDRDRYRTESAHDSGTPKTATATCPVGEVAFGGGGRVVDGNGSVLLTSVVPDGDSVTVTAGALPDYDTAWSVVAVVVCYPPEPAAVAARSAALVSSTQSVVAHASAATCPSGTDLSGTGFALAGSPGQQLLTGLVPDTGTRSVSVSVVNTASGMAKPTAYAVCVPPLGAPYYPVRVEGNSATDTAVPKVASAAGAPAGGDDWAVLSGAGGLIVDGPSDAFLDTVVPDAGLLSATARANRLPGGPAANPWTVTAYGTDAYYY